MSLRPWTEEWMSPTRGTVHFAKQQEITYMSSLIFFIAYFIKPYRDQVHL